VVAWCVHLLTAAGSIPGLLALLDVGRGEFRGALLWMALAVLIDGVDGPLARRFRVARVLPAIDGALLDNLVDYLNYAVVPACFIYRLALLPEPLGLPAAAAICVAAAFQLAHRDAKSPAHMFRGFPSYWNFLAFYYLMLRPPGWLALALLLALVALSFAPVHFVYPTRTRSHRRTTALLTALFALLVLVAVVRYPRPTPWAVWGSLLYGVYYVALSVKLRAVGP